MGNPGTVEVKLRQKTELSMLKYSFFPRQMLRRIKAKKDFIIL